MVLEAREGRVLVPPGTIENSPGWFGCFLPNLILGKLVNEGLFRVPEGRLIPYLAAPFQPKDIFLCCFS